MFNIELDSMKLIWADSRCYIVNFYFDSGVDGTVKLTVLVDLTIRHHVNLDRACTVSHV